MKLFDNFSKLQSCLQQGIVSCRDVVDYFLHNIQNNNNDLNAFIHIYEQEARQYADSLNHKIRKGQGGKLAGMVVGLKDVISYKKHPLQASSKILEGFIAQFNATVTQRLLDEDAVIIGHQNCDQFGMGSSTENSVFGATRNAIDLTRVAGGSSGGSATAVQAKMCHVALGSDTGGSVRQPASFCGIVGLKPTYGRISRHGLVAYASSLDTIGIFAHNVQDCAHVLEVIAGSDEFDSTSATRPIPPYVQNLHYYNNKKAKVAYFKEAFTHEGLQAEVKEKTWETLCMLQKEGHQVDAIDYPELQYALPTYYILANAEASTNLARFDGVRYGHRASCATSLEEMYCKTRGEGFGQEVKKRIMLGTFILSATYYNFYYVKAQKVRTLIKSKIEAILKDYDFIILPTTPTTAFKLNSNIKNKVDIYLADYYTVPASVASVPAISIPNGVDNHQLPIGLQIITNAFEEQKLLAFANYIEGLNN